MSNPSPQTKTIPLDKLKPGTVIRYHQTQYKAWNHYVVEHLGGTMLTASRRDGADGWRSEAVALYFANPAPTVEVVV